eukprot:SAG31_NODE_5028_length_2795_cov_2.351261_1_plen_80_part_00
MHVILNLAYAVLPALLYDVPVIRYFEVVRLPVNLLTSTCTAVLPVLNLVVLASLPSARRAVLSGMPPTAGWMSCCVVDS